MNTKSSHCFASLQFPMRAQLCLKASGIHTVDELLTKTKSDLLGIPALGRTTVAAIVDRLANVGLFLHNPNDHSRGLGEVKSTDDANLEKRGGWTYLLISSAGETYLGATTDLRARLRAHNRPGNSAWTRGRRWHLLATKRFETRLEAFDHESMLKKLPHKKIIWKLECLERAYRIRNRHGYDFDPGIWETTHHPSYVKAARRSRAELNGK